MKEHKQTADEINKVLVGDFGCNYTILPIYKDESNLQESIIVFKGGQNLHQTNIYNAAGLLIKTSYYYKDDSVLVSYKHLNKDTQHWPKHYKISIHSKHTNFVDTLNHLASFAQQKATLKQIKLNIDQAINSLLSCNNLTEQYRLPKCHCSKKQAQLLDKVYTEKLFNLNPSPLSIGNGRRATGIMYVNDGKKEKSTKVYYLENNNSFLIENISRVIQE